MRTRAVAVPSDRSNAVGPVELECTPLGLLIVHRGVGAFQDGYAPGAVTSGTKIMVPWAAVREAAFEGDRLLIAVDEAITPHNRLMLAGFSNGDPPEPQERRKQRFLLRAGIGAAVVVGGLLTAATVLRLSSDSGAATAILLGCLSAAVILVLGMVADQRLGISAQADPSARLEFAAELSMYVPGLSMSPARTARPAVLPPLPSFQLLLPRSTTAVVITMTAALLGAVLTANWISRAPVETADYRRVDPRFGEEPGRGAPATLAAPAVNPAPEAPAPAPPPSAAEPAQPIVATPAVVPSSPSGVAPLAGSCSCPRAESVLWRDGIPKMSTVLIERRLHQRHGHDHLDLELGVVNNSSQPIPEVSLLVQFYERDPAPSTKRSPTFDRPLYFEGPFLPGQAIKWHVEARGNDFDVIGAPEAMLDPMGSDAAPTNLFAELLKANHRPIRLHGAMMLSWLGDPRARDGALSLREALREDEAPYIDRLTWTFGEVRTCGVEATGGADARSVRVCVFNTTNEPRKNLALRMRALDRAFSHRTPVEAPPLVLAERTFKLSGELAPKTGSLASVVFETSNPDGTAPKVFEAYADRDGLL
jgi:hypothetical protein